ncbi:MAG: ERCC4 domain-containing protein [Candidatus Pacearchaeota archaeon]|jgi:Fanconi anemia group M protein
MPKFYEIFSKKQESEQIESSSKQLPKIIIDHREKNSLVPSELSHLGHEIEFSNLEVGDFIVKDTIIERKTVSDFISSMINKRLLKQLLDLQQFENKLLIIEGIEEKDLYQNDSGISENAIKGFVLSILLKYKVPIVFTKDAQDTASFISILAKKQEREITTHFRKRTSDVHEQIQHILEGFPGIGPKTARKLIKEFHTIKGIINASQEDLEKSIGKKAEIFKIASLTNSSH